MSSGVGPRVGGTVAEVASLRDRRIVIGVTGGIAAYKAPLVVRRLVKAGAEVDVVLTRGGARFVGAATFEGLTGRSVRTEVWDDVENETHVALARHADVVAVYPATAHTLARAAAGLADDLLTTTLLATRAPVIMAPAMHTEMWDHPATRANAAALVERGIELVGPADGALMGGDVGAGRAAEPDVFVSAVVRALHATHTPREPDDAGGPAGGSDHGGPSSTHEHPADGRVPLDVVRGDDHGNATTGRRASRPAGSGQPSAPVALDRARPTTGSASRQRHADPASADWAGRHVVVTAGGTREPLDPVRYLGNRSSGRMGVAIARAAADRGARVTLVIAPSDLPTPEGVERVDVTTAREMHEAVLSRAEADVVVKAAAVADFRPRATSDHKLKKADGVPQLELVRNPDILADLGARRAEGGGGPLVLVGFAAETTDVESHARDKLARKQADLLVVNDVSAPGAGFGHDTNEVVILGDDGSRVEVPLTSKDEVAVRLLDVVATRLEAAEAVSPAPSTTT